MLGCAAPCRPTSCFLPGRPYACLAFPPACRTPYKELTTEFGLVPVKKVWNVERRLGAWKDIQRDFFEDDVSGWLSGWVPGRLSA